MFKSKKIYSLLSLCIILTSLIIGDIETHYSGNPKSAHGQQTEKAPAFQDSYWTDKTIASGNNSDKLEEKEVGPGEGVATLALVLVNKAQSEITAVKGYLSLPTEFQAVKTRNINSSNTSFTSNFTNSNDSISINNASENAENIAVASYDSIIMPGEEFTLYFDVNILNNANVGLYEASLDLLYSKVLTAGDIIVQDIATPFRVPGKVILDVKSNDQYITPGQINRANIDIINKGSADANSAIITISNANDNDQASLTTVSSAASIESTENITGSTTNTSRSNASGSVINNEASHSGNAQNNATSPLTTIGTQRFSVGVIPAGEIISIPSAIYPAITTSEGLQNLNVEVSYGNPLGNRETIDFSLGFVISAQPTNSNFDVYFNSNFNSKNINQSILNTNNITNLASYPNSITAGTIEGIGLTIEKTTPSEAKDVIISISPSSDSAKLLGSSRWSFETIKNKTIDLYTDIFASEDLIGKPIQFNVDINYILDGLSKSESLGLGMYVDGNITIRAYDFELNTIGDEPNLVANLLNEGNMDALFTTVEMIPPPYPLSNNEPNGNNITLVQEYPALQYIGDLAENSPLPISIPLEIPNRTKGGEYPVFLKVLYKDNLRNSHEITVNSTVDYIPDTDESRSNNGTIFGMGSINPLVIIVIVVFTFVIFLVIRKVRGRRKKRPVLQDIPDDRNSKNDLDPLLEK